MSITSEVKFLETIMAGANHRSPGAMIRFWRKTRRLSQLELALEIDVSSRHLSFVENGRSQPSRNLLLRLSAALRIPPRYQNSLLETAGYASAFTQQEMSDERMSIVREAMARVLENHEPYPAIVVDATYEILMANQGFHSIATFFLGDPISGTNAMQLLFSPNGLSKYVENWPGVRAFLLDRVLRETLASGNPNLATLYQSLAAGEHPVSTVDLEMSEHLPLMELRLKKGSTALSFFSMISSIGTAIDITAREIRLETFFPADESTREWFQACANASP